MWTVIRSGRFYFWPIICANVLTMAVGVRANPIRAILFSLVISCLASFGFLLNDIWDRDVDRVNNARHFENSHLRTVAMGTAAGAAFLLAGLFLAYVLGPAEFSLATSIAAALAGYTLFLRRLLFVPTIAAALLASSPLWTPLVLWDRDTGVLKGVFVGAIALILAAREIFMDARDRAGDIVGGRDTLATVFGERTAKFVGVVLTGSGSLAFVAIVTFGSISLPAFSKIVVTVVSGTILFLLVSSAVKTLLGAHDERAAIQRYVLHSRAAMALIPLLVLILWRT